MASINLDGATETAISSLFMSLPGELRNAIYNHYFEAIFESQSLEPTVTCRHVESLRPALSMLRTSRAIRSEASSIFWIDFVTRCRWGFGARHEDDDRMASFCEAARRYTSKVDWLVLQSAFELTEDIEALRRLCEELEIKHQAQQGFVWAKPVNLGSRGGTMVMQYTYQPGERCWVRFWGPLAMIEWRNIFALTEAGVESRA
jgi:hypothetical protein